MLNGPYNIIGLIILVLDLVAIIGVIGGRSSFERKALWTLLILFLPLLGMILYYAIGKSRQDASPG
jgi:hypothetical protein